jgi:hypothetical protein
VKPAIPGLARALKAAGVAGLAEIHPLPGGANNRVYRVDAGGRSVLAKVYFRHARDQRDRLGAESAFLEFARRRKLTCVPELLSIDSDRGTALMEFVPGRKLRPEEVTWERVAEAVAFFEGLNRDRTSAPAKRLPSGSEACFSVDAHLECVDRRLARLRGVDDRDAAAFIRERLVPAWEAVSRTIRASSKPLARGSRCISPSDFGFHNALLRPDGRLCFIDFEYAGWDDPAKTACDFFCQPAVPVPGLHLDRFVEGIARGLGRPEDLRARVRALLPAYRLKWCCILLNEFLPVGGARRKFASKECDPEERKADQLKKAKAALEGLHG